MVNKVMKVLVSTILIVIVVGCAKDNEEGPIETAIKLKQSISLNSYEKFQSLFFEQRKSKATRELFNQLRELDDSKADYKSYSLVTLGNGQMILVNHAPGGDYQIQDVIIVSDEMKPLLEKMINP